jgi:RHS repeat-associated protein
MQTSTAERTPELMSWVVWLPWAFLLSFVPVSAQSQEVVPPVKPWNFTSATYCNMFGTQHTFQSSWPGDSPHEIWQQWVELLDQTCAGSAGSSKVVTHTLNACTPTIGVGIFAAQAHSCTFRRHINPKPGCAPEWACQPGVVDEGLPSADKICNTPQLDNRTQLTRTSAPTYVECTCPAGMILAGTPARCVPIINETRKPTDMCAGNPIQPATGNKRQADVDYVGTGGASLTFSRIYNSGSSFDQKWTSNFHRSTTWASSGSSATHLFHRPDGSYPFAWNGSAYVADPDVNLRYIGNGDLVLEDGRLIEHYTSQQMDQVRTRSGTVLQTLTYSTASTPTSIAPFSGLLIGINNVFGQALSLTYDAQGRMATMTDPGAGLYQYAYDASGSLSSVTYPDGETRTYVYNEPAHTGGASGGRLLTGIIDESNQRYATFGYDANGLAVLTEHAGGTDRYTVSYSSGPSVASELVLDASNQVKYVRRYYQPPAQASLTDALGHTRDYSFVQLNGSTKTTGSTAPGTGTCSAIPQERSFDANGNSTSTIDFNGYRTCHTYDLTRNLETVRVEGFEPGASCPGDLAAYAPAAGTRQRKITTQWHPTFRLPTQIDEAGKRTTLSYDADGNVLTKTERDMSTNQSRTWTYTYNSYGQVLTANSPRTDVSDVTTYTYYTCTSGYQCGQIHTITNAAGHVTTYNSYNAHGQPLTITDPNGVVTTLTYDLRQRLTSRTVGSETTTFAYWPTGLPKKATLPDGSYIEYTYDAAHRLTGINDAEGNRIHYTLDLMGNRTGEQSYDPSNTLTRTRTRVFDTLNRLQKEIGAAGTTNVTTTFGYDNSGNQTSIAAPLGRDTTQGYDELNRLTSVTDPLSGVTQYGYNALDQLISVTDPRGLVTSYSYNALGDLKQQTSPDTGVTTNTYDSGGNLATSTDARNAVATYTYDALNRVATAAFSDGSTTDQTLTYSYDAGTHGKGRLTGVSDANHSLSWTYDDQGRALTATQAVGSVSKTTSYTYANGLRQSMTTPSGQVITYGYTDGKVTSISVNGTPVVSGILYDPFGPVRQWTWADSSLAVRTFDQDGKVALIDSAGLKSYSYDDAFRITGITDTTNSALSWTYGYDDLDRLTSASKTGTTLGYTYDANGNRLTETGSTPSTFTVATNSNRLSSTSGSLSRTYGYDNAGNATSFTGISFTYNNRGRMSSSTKSGVTTNYVYNALGQLVKKGTSTLYYYDEAGHILGIYDGSGALTEEIVWLGDTPIATLRSQSGGGVRVYNIHTDHLNTPRVVTDSLSDVVRWRWDGDPFGGRVVDDDPSSVGAFAFDLRFPGQIAMVETGLHYNYFRDYDPATGRYVQSDPLGIDGGIGTYSYAGNTPIALTDPTGLEPPRGGERGATGGAGGQNTNNPSKHCRELNPPEEKFVECKHHQTGKWIRKPRSANMPFPGAKSEMCGEQCQDTGATVIVTAGGAYIVYRCARMIPSLFPPLWPTIPANAAIP